MTTADAAKHIIIEEIKGILHAFELCDKETRTHFMLGGLLYNATIICNADDWCRKANISIRRYISTDVLEKLRAKIKLYSSDTVIPFSQQQVEMAEIIEVEKQYWIDDQARSGKWCPKFLIPDAGAYKINGHYIGNTMEYAYEYSPLNPERKPILNVLGGEDMDTSLSYQFGVQIGQSLQELYAKMTGEFYAFSSEDKSSLIVEDCDFRMSNHLFFKNSNGIYAFNLLCRMNYLLELFIPLCKDNEFLSFRMLYITFYHLKYDLENFSLSSIHYDMPFRSKDFRNTMAHYSLYGKITEQEINQNVVGYGLFEKFFKESFSSVNEKMKTEFIKTRDSLEEYVRI